MIGVDTVSQLLMGISLGTLATTFLVWVIVDPLIGMLEMLLPASRRHCVKRLAQAKAEREQIQRDNQRLLVDISSREDSERHRWQELMKPYAEKLAVLLMVDEIDFKRAEREAVGIGARAWQIGGLSCMRELRDMALAVCKDKSNNREIVDYIAFWWDGIGNWRNPSLGH